LSSSSSRSSTTPRTPPAQLDRTPFWWHLSLRKRRLLVHKSEGYIVLGERLNVVDHRFPTPNVSNIKRAITEHASLASPTRAAHDRLAIHLRTHSTPRTARWRVDTATYWSTVNRSISNTDLAHSNRARRARRLRARLAARVLPACSLARSGSVSEPADSTT